MKLISINPKSCILDMNELLLIFENLDENQVRKLLDGKKIDVIYRRGITKKGRDAVWILVPDNEYPEKTGYIKGKFYIYEGWGDRTWSNWAKRRPIGEGVISHAIATSNGGGCWVEFVIIPETCSDVLTSEQVQYLKEIGQ